ncbi:ketoacyl-ACP synthase III [Actibacterium sp. 188UL27-1]|uniref:ketoacyl-ACP synthase III n=1 Tax=Actibacterium sp. 188UL27-1 TaxID=2786961 RepID=UPI00195E3ED9|nr:ketoacyl-ACP synthase III [Actibacterium sp. 188UL27-1]MBM7069030.1 ketoacyl-ACP synthase III [Actibacterium sp. 188UL27-1]
MSLEAVASAVPALHQTVEEIAAQCDADVEFVRTKVGVAGRYIMGPGETGIGLADAACTKLFTQTDLTAADIGLLVFVTQNPDRRLPNNAAGLAHALGLPKTVASFDLSLGCSGFVYGLSVTEAFLQAHGIENALLVTCDPYSRIMAPEDKATNAVFGDAATATLVTRSGTRSALSGLDFGTDGGGGDAIRIDAGGAAAPLVALDTGDGLQTGDRDAHRLIMEGRAVFNFVNATIPSSIANSLTKADLTLDDIDWFALHQGSEYMLDSLARRSRIPGEKVLKNIATYGNTVSSTIPLLVEQLLAQGKLDSRSRVLISGFGVGLSWATGVLTFSGANDD